MIGRVTLIEIRSRPMDWLTLAFVLPLDRQTEYFLLHLAANPAHKAQVNSELRPSCKARSESGTMTSRKGSIDHDDPDHKQKLGLSRSHQTLHLLQDF